MIRTTAIFVALVSIGTSSAPAAPIQWGGNGHYYDFVPAIGISWNTARAGATSMSFSGQTGHLVTITSAGENAFLTANFSTGGGPRAFAWTGGFEPADNGVWRWADGPESGVQYSNFAVPTLPFNYANWGGIEPNDAGATEDFMAFNIGPGFAGIATGQWADSPQVPPLGSDPIQGYLVEYSIVPEPAGFLIWGVAMCVVLIIVRQRLCPAAGAA